MIHTEQRIKKDRREQLHPFSLHALYGRRCEHRRMRESHLIQHEVDVYPSGLMAVTVVILLLCALDAHNTLIILSRGGIEINPLMDFLIQTDIRLFVAGKFALTGLGILLFVGYHHVRLWERIKVLHILYSLLLFYLLLIAYQLVLLAC